MKIINKILLLLPLLLPNALFAQTGNWEIGSALTKGLRGGQAVVVDSTIFVLGGYSDSIQAAVDWVQKFNPLTGKFTLVGRMKKRRAYHTAVVLGKKIIYAGGEYYNRFSANGTIETFNTENNLTSYLDSNKTFNRSYMAGVISDSTIYFIGGEPYSPPGHGGGTLYPYIVEYSVSARFITYSYTSQFSNDKLREGQMAALHNQYIYIFGGAYNTVLPSIFRYNRLNHQLTQMNSNMMIPRANGALFKTAVSTQALIFGGYNEGGYALNSAESYTFIDSVSISARQQSPLNFKRKSFMSAFVNNTIYIFGGTDEFGQYVKPIEKQYIPPVAVGDKDLPAPPESFTLRQNYPNPFGGAVSAGKTTTISYYVPVPAEVNIRIYNSLGEEIASPVSAGHDAGSYSFTYNASGLPAGLYVCEMSAAPGNFSGRTVRNTIKMLLLK